MWFALAILWLILAAVDITLAATGALGPGAVILTLLAGLVISVIIVRSA